jgi:toxin CcdB
LPRQFDIVENLNIARRIQYPFLIVLQHDRVSSLGSVIAAPLVAAGLNLRASRLHPAIVVATQRYVVMVEQLAAVDAKSLGRIVASAEAIRYEIIAAVDLLFTGI